MFCQISTDHNIYTSSKNLGESIEKIKLPKLVNELILHIFSFLDVQSLNRCFLVSHKWKMLSSDRVLWNKIFEDFDLSKFKIKLFFMNEAWQYRSLSISFNESNCFGAAIAAAEKCAKFDAIKAAYAFKEICQKACEVKDYKTASQCQKLSKQHFADAGNLAMSFLIKSRVENADFLDHCEKLVELSLSLIDQDREFGLQALLAIAKKLADLSMFEKAIDYTELATALRGSRSCNRARNKCNDVHPFLQMAEYMIYLKQYVLAEECAKKADQNDYDCQWIYADIVIQQIQEENFVNESLFSKLETETMPWMKASEALVFGLIDNNRYCEAQKIAKSILQATWDFGKSKFKRKLEEKLVTLNTPRAYNEFK